MDVLQIALEYIKQQGRFVQENTQAWQVVVSLSITSCKWVVKLAQSTTFTASVKLAQVEVYCVYQV